MTARTNHDLVPRWKPCTDGSNVGLEIAEDGGWVLAEHFAALRAELEDAEKEVVYLEAENRRLKAQLKGCSIAARDYKEALAYGEKAGFGDEFKHVLTCRQSLDDAIAQLTRMTQERDNWRKEAELAVAKVAEMRTNRIQRDSQ